MKPKIIDSAFLYVREDGSEIWHKPYKPDGPSLLVDLVRMTGGWQQRTYTRLVYKVADVVAHHAIIAKARGANWEVIKIEGQLVVWQRPHNKDDWPEGPPSIVPGNREEVV
jgi:hypothetical protein